MEWSSGSPFQVVSGMARARGPTPGVNRGALRVRSHCCTGSAIVVSTLSNYDERLISGTFLSQNSAVCLRCPTVCVSIYTVSSTQTALRSRRGRF